MDITVENKGKVFIFTLSGEFYIGNVHDFEKLWESKLTEDPSIMAIDCKNLEFVDSSAIGTLVKLFNGINKKTTQIVFVDLNKSIIALFDRAKLAKLFKILTRDKFEKEYLEK